jgi:eukaryotic-like serine/threonine-protein kinase
MGSTQRETSNSGPASTVRDASSFIAAYHDALLSGQAVASLSQEVEALDASSQVAFRRAERVLRGLVIARDAFPAASFASGPESRHASGTSLALAHAPSGSPTPLKQLGRFAIKRELGRGGLGVVFLAHDPTLNRLVALKVPRPDVMLTAESARRFDREAQATARLSHPNLVPIYEVGEAGAIAYIATAYCRGPNLCDWLRDQVKPVAARTAARLIAQLADAIDYAHAQGVLHRDIKPTNILLEPMAGVDDPQQRRPDGDLPFTPKLVDFGLARIEGVASSETRTGVAIGTPAYMAPEQAAGDVRQIGPATDVYGLGTILYELLTGRGAFGGASDVQTLRQVLENEPVRPRALRPALPADLEAICLKCLEKIPQKRYPAAGALHADLGRYLAGQPTEARPRGAVQRVLKWARRRPALAGLLGVSVAATIAIVALMAIYVARLRFANQAAEESRIAAEISAEKSQRQEGVTNQYLYASQMRLAYQSLDQGEVEQARQLIDHYKPGSPLEDLRGFEWYHLKRRLHSERLTLAGHKGEVYAVTFSPDGRQLVSGGQDGTIRFWDAESGTELKTVMAHRSCVNAVVYSPDGAILASGSCDHTIRLWDAATLAPLATLDGHLDEVHCLAFCPTDPSLLAAGGHEPLVRVWDLATGEITRTLDVGGGVDGLVWRPDGKALVMAGRSDQGEPRSCFWRVDENRIEWHPWTTRSVAVSPKGCVCWGSDSAMVRLGAAADSRPLMLSGHVGQISAVAFSPEGDWIASGGDDRVIRIWDASANLCTQIFAGHSGRVQSLAFSPNGSTLASASFDGTIKLWKGEPMDRTVWTTESYSVGQTAGRLFAISSDFRYMALLSKWDEVNVLQLDDGSPLGTLRLQCRTRGLQFLPERPVLFGAAVEAPSGVDEWDVENWKSIKTHRMPDVPVHWLALWDQYLVVEQDTMTSLTDISTGRRWQDLMRFHKVASGYNNPSEFVLSPDGASLVICRGKVDEHDWIMDASDGRLPRQLAAAVPAEGFGMLTAVSNGGELLAGKFDNYSIAVIESKLGRRRVTLRHPYVVGAAAFSPDDKTLATCCGDRTVILWSVVSGQEIARFTTRPGNFEKVQFSSNGRRLAAISRAGIEEVRLRHVYPDGIPIESLEKSTATITIWAGTDTE